MPLGFPHAYIFRPLIISSMTEKTCRIFCITPIKTPHYLKENDMPAFLVDTNRCKKDGICASVCPVAALCLNDDKFPKNTPEGAARCISCGQCIAFCPHGACSLEGIAADTPTPDFSKKPPEEQLTAFLLSRRSIRQYRKEPVPQSTVDAIMEGVRYAPSAANTQPLRWILINSREHLKKAGDLVAQGMEALAPDDVHLRSTVAAWRSGTDVYFRNAPQLMIAVAPKDWPWGREDGAVALTHFEMHALAHGVGCCWAGYLTFIGARYAPLEKFLGVEGHEVIVGAQFFGIPKLLPHALPPRKKINLTIR